MKKIVLMVAVVACVAFASQGVQASTVQVSVENVMQDDFVKIEVKELPQAVQDAIAKSYEGSTVKEAYVAGADGGRKGYAERLEAGYVAFAVILGAEDQFQCFRQAENLQHVEPDGQENTGADQQADKRWAPHERVDGIECGNE